MKKSNLCNFNFEKIGKKYFISNDFGNWLMIGAGDFNKISNDEFSEKSKIYQSLKKEGFLRDYLDFEGLALTNNCSTGYSGNALEIAALITSSSVSSLT